MKNITAVLLTALLVLTVSLNLACQKQAASNSNSGTGGSGAGGAGTEIQGAQQLLDKIRASTSFEQLPDLLTNRTPAGLAFPLIIFTSMGIAFSEAPPPGAAGSEPPAGPSEKTKQLQAELEGILKRYGMDDETMKDDAKRKAAEPQIESRGRELLTELVAFTKKISPDKEPEKGPPVPPNDTLSFEKLSPT